MSWLAWIVLGLIAGALARLVMPGRDPGGLITTIVIGILGALIGGFVGRLSAASWGACSASGTSKRST